MNTLRRQAKNNFYINLLKSVNKFVKTDLISELLLNTGIQDKIILYKHLHRKREYCLNATSTSYSENP